MNDLRHGYTLADINGIARGAAAANRFMASDHIDRYETAWSEIVYHLYTADDPPSIHDLAIVGRRAIWAMVKDHRQTYGYRDRDPWNGVGSAPMFARYWVDAPPLPYDDRIVENLAVTQIMRSLDARDQQVLLALASAGTNQAAAELLGIPYRSFTAYLSAARRRWLTAWHEGETPSRPRQNRTAGVYDPDRLQPCGTHAAYRRHKRAGEPIDDACQAAYRDYETEYAQKRLARRNATSTTVCPGGAA